MKRILSILLILVLVVSTLPAVALAVEAEVKALSSNNVRFQFDTLPREGYQFDNSPFLHGARIRAYRDGVLAHEGFTVRGTGRHDWNTTIGNTEEFRFEITFPSGWVFHSFRGFNIVQEVAGNPYVRIVRTEDIIGSPYFNPGFNEYTVNLGWGAVPGTHSQPQPTHPFTDINPNTWYHNAVQHVFQNEIMNGTSATAFSPQSSLNRAMVATVLSRIGDNSSISFRPIFHDVSPGQWYSGPITWAHDRGVVTGMPDGSFVPGRNIPTEQLAVMIHRYAESRGLNLTVPNHVTAPAGTSDWAAEAMGWAIHNGFLRSHSPHAPATRAETAYFVYRFSVHYEL